MARRSLFRMTRVLLGLGLALHLLTGSSAAGTGEAEMRLYLKIGCERHRVVPTEAGWKQGAELLQQTLAADDSAYYEGAPIWRLYQQLRRPAVQRALARVAGTSSRSSFSVVLMLTNSKFRVYPGEKLWIVVPGSDRGRELEYTVREGDDLWKIASRYRGVEVQDIYRTNVMRFDRGACCGTDEKGSVIYFEHQQLTKDDPVDNRLLRILLHEAGHAGDDTTSELVYGPDRRHHLWEILSPSTAFVEGWANYQSTHAPGRSRKDNAAFMRSPETDEIDIEGSLEKQGVPGELLRVQDRDLTLADLLSVEVVVGRILVDIEGIASPGDARPTSAVTTGSGPGRKMIEEAFVATQGCKDRTLADLLGVIIRKHPAVRDPVLAVVRKQTRSLFADDDYPRLLDGSLPEGVEPNKVPRSRDYVPSPIEPASEATGNLNAGISAVSEVPIGLASGLFGM